MRLGAGRRVAGWMAVLAVAAGGVRAGQVLGRMRCEAQTAMCRVNVQQLAMGLHLYAADYEARLPPAERWAQLVDPYVRAPLAFRCPARPGD
ncbi:MAG: hypothetical protein QHJ73_05925, partial [Armatimonadota bacterium]|nr:hypothetical protein [Armatimonadota bacterium]